MMGRAYRGKGQRNWGNGQNEVPDDMPSPSAPIEERRAWLLANHGPEAFSDEALEEMEVRTCALPECESKAVARSLFCSYHQRTAVGEAGARELRQLTREMERLGRITDKDAKQHAVRKFRSRAESGDFAILFSGKMQETLDDAAADLELSMELGGLRLAMVRALQEIDDPTEMSLAISRLSNAAVRASKVNVEERKRKVWNRKLHEMQAERERRG
ncbi:MAG: hypothetical protein M9947_11360 [Thermomicrobiales bacterium]|nr:hypothetical protein [Thermomicrobiales bacterium]